MMCVPIPFVEFYSTTDEWEKLSAAPFSVGEDYSTIRYMKTHIRERIKAARKHAGLTQEKLGELIGITKSAVSMWETSNPKKYTRPTLENLKELSKLTGAPLNWLLDDDAEISSDWKCPAEVVEFPNAADKPSTIALQAAQLIESLPREEQLQILHYLQVRIQTKVPPPEPER